MGQGDTWGRWITQPGMKRMMWGHIEKVAHPSSDGEGLVGTTMVKIALPEILLKKKAFFTRRSCVRGQVCPYSSAQD